VPRTNSGRLDSLSIFYTDSTSEDLRHGQFA
jgi:hypothetical protein